MRRPYGLGHCWVFSSKHEKRDLIRVVTWRSRTRYDGDLSRCRCKIIREVQQLTLRIVASMSEKLPISRWLEVEMETMLSTEVIRLQRTCLDHRGQNCTIAACFKDNNCKELHLVTYDGLFHHNIVVLGLSHIKRLSPNVPFRATCRPADSIAFSRVTRPFVSLTSYSSIRLSYCYIIL